MTREQYLGVIKHYDAFIEEVDNMYMELCSALSTFDYKQKLSKEDIERRNWLLAAIHKLGNCYVS